MVAVVVAVAAADTGGAGAEVVADASAAEVGRSATEAAGTEAATGVSATEAAAAKAATGVSAAATTAATTPRERGSCDCSAADKDRGDHGRREFAPH